VLALVGCGEGGGEKLVKVEGKATVNGQPLPGGTVVLTPIEARKGATPTGTVGQDGSFKLATGGKPGAPLGKYKVTLTPAPALPPEPTSATPPKATKIEKNVHPKYENPEKTDLTIEVVNPPPAGGYELKFTK